MFEENCRLCWNSQTDTSQLKEKLRIKVLFSHGLNENLGFNSNLFLTYNGAEILANSSMIHHNITTCNRVLTFHRNYFSNLTICRKVPPRARLRIHKSRYNSI